MTTSKPLVLKWAWRHFVLQVETFDSVEDAIGAAGVAAGGGYEALDCIEIIDGADSRVISSGEALNQWWAEERRRRQEEPVSTPPRYRIRIAHPADPTRQATHGAYSEAAAERKAAELRTVLGDRVRVVALKVAV